MLTEPSSRLSIRNNMTIDMPVDNEFDGKRVG